MTCVHNEDATTRHGRLIVLCGPAGVGKGTVLGRVRAQHPGIWLSVSATTRQPRPGEVDGVNYYFMSEREFLDREARGEFLETADVFGLAHYGTPAAGKIVMYDAMTCQFREMKLMRNPGCEVCGG